MVLNVTTPWHKASFDTFLNERLPELLAERLPLVGYQVTETDTYACRVTVTLAENGGEMTVVYEDLSAPCTTTVIGRLFPKRGTTISGPPRPRKPPRGSSASA